MMISHSGREILGLQNVGVKRKTGNASDTNKIKLGHSNVDHSPHLGQGNMLAHISD